MIRTLSLVAGVGLALGGAGCILPDVHDDPGPAVSGGSGGSGGSDGGNSGVGGAGGSGGSTPAGCPATGLVGLRFANLAPSPGAVDFCLGTQGNLSGPVAKLASAAGGIEFSAFMTYDYVVDGPIDIRVVPAGGSCSGESLGDIQDLCLESAAGGGSVSVYYIAGQAGGAPPLAVLEDGKQDAGALKLRFFNTIQGASGADFGLTDDGALPTVVSTAVASNVPFGEVPPPGNTILNVPVNEAGYLEITDMPAGIAWQGWGVALAGEPAAAAVVPFSTVSSNMGIVLTVIAAGKVGDPKYPVKLIGFTASEPGGGTMSPQQAPDANTALD